MTAHAPRMLIVGAGLAGTGAAAALRDAGFDGEVVLLGDEPYHPYDHVPLSKDYLRGEDAGYHRLFLHDDDFYASRSIDLRRDCSVTRFDPAAQRVHLASGEQLAYDALLLATGSRNRTINVPGADLAGIFSLRTLADADRLRAALAPARRLVVVGSGFVGCEIAASARQLGLEVTIVGRDRLPMLGALGPEMAAFYRDLHREHGVDLRICLQVNGFHGVDGRVRQVELSDGTRLDADMVFVGVGAEPRVELAAAAGLEVDGGIVTDEFLATSADRIYAAGDVAGVWDPLLQRHCRTEHFAAALTQGPVAARSMLDGVAGDAVPYDAVPFFFTDQFGVWMEHTGYAHADADLVLRGSVADGAFVAFWVRDRRLVAAMNVNIRGVPDIATRLIRNGVILDPSALEDPDVDLAGMTG